MLTPTKFRKTIAAISYFAPAALLLSALTHCAGSLAPRSDAHVGDTSDMVNDRTTDATMDHGIGVDTAGDDATVDDTMATVDDLPPVFDDVVVLPDTAPPVMDAGSPLDTSLPGGRERFVFATGSLIATSRANWVRLGTYTFNPSAHTITASDYVWTQTAPVARIGMGTTPSANCAGSSTTVHDCEILTAGGYTAAPNETRSGTYSISADATGPFVSINWPSRPSYTEVWSIVPSADGRYVTLDLRTSGGFQYGFAAGSHAAFSTRRAMSSVQATTASLGYDFHSWQHDSVVHALGSRWSMNLYGVCDRTTWAMTYRQPSSATSCYSGCIAPYNADTSIEYYISRVGSTDRRDTLWHWCTCLAKGATCYLGNSHVKPMLEVIDDVGTFRGWVGVEASFSASASTDPRGSDMLSVWRVFER